MKVVLTQSPKPTKKYRIQFVNTGKTVDFGAKGYSDYTIHKDPARMRLYVQRHGGKVPKNAANLLKVKKSNKENWSDPHTAGFWSRWLLWSFPNMTASKKHIRDAFGITIKTR